MPFLTAEPTLVQVAVPRGGPGRPRQKPPQLVMDNISVGL
jgi:hypothetical protein